MVKILTDHIDVKNYHQIETYLKYGGYKSIQKTVTYTPENGIEEVIAAHLTGRGGAGFPAGIKWRAILDTPKPCYLVINADEGEPGTFKDRFLIERNPHLIIEGIIDAALILGVETVYIYLRGEYHEPYKQLMQTIEEAKQNKLLDYPLSPDHQPISITVIQGAGAYICGEETALLNSIEGKRGEPRLKPPYPAQKGLWGAPTIINNVETIACIPYIMEHGGKAYAQIGCADSGGTRLYSISGQVKSPGVYERPCGYPLKKLIYNDAGGKSALIKGVIPGGLSTTILTREEMEQCTFDRKSLAKCQSSPGSAGVIVIGEDQSLLPLLRSISSFYAQESCGQCTPCREGIPWLNQIIQDFVKNGSPRSDIALIKEIGDQIKGRTICALGEAAVTSIMGILTKFEEEIFNCHKEHSKQEQWREQ